MSLMFLFSLRTIADQEKASSVIKTSFELLRQDFQARAHCWDVFSLRGDV